MIAARPRATRSWLPGLALLLALGAGCSASFDVSIPSPSARRIYAGPLSPVVPLHAHARGCGHHAVWFDGHETYLEGDLWVFYSPSRASWLRYDEPPRELVKAAGRIRRASAS